MLFLVVIQGMSCGRNFPAFVTLKCCGNMIGFNMPSHVISPGIGVGAERAGWNSVPGADVLVHEPVQLVQARDQH